MSKTKSRLKKFGETEYSDDKGYINAIVTSDSRYSPKKKTRRKAFMINMWVYAAIVFSLTILSLGMLSLPKSFNDSHKTLVSVIEIFVFVILAMDLAARWYTSEVRMKKGNWSYFLFPITVVGLMLIASLLPSLYLINVWTGTENSILKTFEHMKFLRIFRIVLLANLIPGISIFRRVLSKEKKILYVVFSIVIITIVLFALVMFNIEEGVDNMGIAKPTGYTGIVKDPKTGWNPESAEFNSFWDSLYFSTITLTTIGFGDKAPSTDMGKLVTMVMSIIGIAVLAIPSGIIAGGFISEIKATNKEKAERKKSRKKSK